MALNRSISMRGPRFYLDGDDLMFVNHIDNSTRDGPRVATDADRAAHPAAYDEMGEAEAAAPIAPMVSFSDPEIKPPEPDKPFARRRAAAEAS